jgi:hypothetical protein
MKQSVVSPQDLASRIPEALAACFMRCCA